MSVDSKDIPITSPCPITLDKSGVGQGDRSLHCGHCVKDVHLLSNMTESEAREFLRTQSGNDICVSYTIQKGGGIRFANPDESRCSSSAPDLVPVSALTRRARPEPVRASAPAAFLAGLGAALLMAACAPHSNASAIKAEETTLAPIAEQVVIPCNPDVEEVVEGGIGEIELVEVDGGIKAVEPPPEQPVAGGIRAMPIPEEHPELVPEEPAVHTPPPAEPKNTVRGRMKPKDPPATGG